MLLDINKLALNRLLQCSTLEDYEDDDNPEYVYESNIIDTKIGSYSVTKNGHWSIYDEENGIEDEPNNIVTQFNFISTAVNYISDLFILVDYSNDSDRYRIYRDIQHSYINPRPDSKGIFGKEYILHSIQGIESKTIYDKFWTLKQKLK